MKKQAYMMTIVIMILTVAGLSSVRAQTSCVREMTANIPFAFSVGEQNLPAGKYSMRCINPSSDRKILQLRGKDGRFSVLVPTNNTIGEADEAKLVFNRQGDRYYFAEVWMEADRTGMKALKLRGELASAREIATTRRAAEMVALTAKR